MLCCADAYADAYADADAVLFYGDDLGQVSWVVGVDVFVDREII